MTRLWVLDDEHLIHVVNEKLCEGVDVSDVAQGHCLEASCYTVSFR